MAINYREMKKLCTASEWGLVQESLPENIDGLSLARLKTKASAAERMRKKWMDLSRKQKRAAGDDDAAVRSMEKAALFGEVRQAFAKRLRRLEREAARTKAMEKSKMLKKSGTANKKRASIPELKKPLQEGPGRKKSIGIPASIKGHISSRNRRDQAQRDSK